MFRIINFQALTKKIELLGDIEFDFILLRQVV